MSSVLAWVLIFSWTSVARAEPLPELGQAYHLDGTASAAQFFAGARVDGMEGFRSEFRTQDIVTLRAEIAVEPQHSGNRGSLFLIAALGDDYYMRNTQGVWMVWDTALDTLLPTVVNQALSPAVPLTILENLAVGDLWLAGNTISFFIAYSVAGADREAEIGDLIYSAAPFEFAINAYNPLGDTGPMADLLDTGFIDTGRQREVPLLFYLPRQNLARPVILFSHGLGGDRFAAQYLGEHWSTRGYVVVFMQHRGSDSSILEGVPPLLTGIVLNQAASASNLIARIEDVSAVIDQLSIWNQDPQHPLHGRLDLNRVGMSGHSFGARTTQVVSGETLSWIGSGAWDPRIRAAMPLSPSNPSDRDPQEGFSSVAMPWLLMTGTLDTARIGNTTVADRLAVYPALPPEGKYELVLFDGEHHAFTDRPLSAQQNPRNPAHHPAIMALSTAFWDAWLRGFGDARRWLEGTGPGSMLQSQDRWQFK